MAPYGVSGGDAATGAWVKGGVFIWFTDWCRNRVNGDTTCNVIILIEKNAEENSKRISSQVVRIGDMGEEGPKMQKCCRDICVLTSLRILDMDIGAMDM